jgi:transketolase
MSDLRKYFFDEMIARAKVDDRIIILSGDLGFSFCEEFERLYQDRYINCGIAEQNMVGVAAGLALAGKRPFVYSNAIFILMRAYEQVRDEVCYNNLPVTLVGTGAAGFLGFSHNMMEKEDRQILAKLPFLRQYYPINKGGLNKALGRCLNSNHPSYVRL